MSIVTERLNRGNFDAYSLDNFIRHQKVEKCWRNREGTWELVSEAFEENWSVKDCRSIAERICSQLGGEASAFGAFSEGKIVGFLVIAPEIFGEKARYVEVTLFQVSEPYRGQGIGRRLFSLAVEEMKRLGAQRLYISAHSSQESQAAYRALGCTLAEEIRIQRAEEEPFDVQMEFREKENP